MSASPKQQPATDWTRHPLWWPEFWLAATTAASVISARRLFDTWDYFIPMLLVGVGSHLLLTQLRRTRFRTSWSLLATALVAAVMCARLLYHETLFAGFAPTGETLRQGGEDLSQSWSEFGFVVAPTEATTGFVLASCFAAWAMAAFSDTLAFRAFKTLTAFAPALVLLVFIGALTKGDYAAQSAGFVFFCALLFAVTQRLANNATPWLYVSTPDRSRAREPVRLALTLAAVAAVAAVVITPLLPGAEGGALVPLKELDGSGGGRPTRIAVSPLVDARGRLVGTSGADLFYVEAAAPAYWRLSGLGTFDGAVWGSNRSYTDASGELQEVNEDEPLLRQKITIESLDSVWLPAAFEATSFEGRDALYDPETATLVVRGGVTLERGVNYEVVSSISVPTVAELEAAEVELPEEIAENYTDLPERFNENIIGLAERITESADTPYAQALLLQNFFLDNFSYSLDVPGGHSSDRIADFLFEERAGYCEQFAGSYAAMARAVGLASRVAVGFTPGELIDGRYSVRGEHYHAWPEVWIGDRWVYFEATPGRGAPRASAYTGVATQQAVPGSPNEFEVIDEEVPSLEDLGLGDGTNTDFSGVIDEFGVSTGAGAGGDNTNRWVLAAFVLTLAIVSAWLVAVPSVSWIQRARRRKGARGDLAAETQAGWEELCEALGQTGLVRSEAESHREFAQRAAHRSRINAVLADSAAAQMDRACYSKLSPTREQVAVLDRNVSELKRELSSQVPTLARIRNTYLRSRRALR